MQPYRAHIVTSLPGYGGLDPFRGLRDFPRNPEELRHHLSGIHHHLQSSFFIDGETADFVLQTEKKDIFLETYEAEVKRIFRRLSKISRRSIKARVDPRRCRGGFEVISGPNSAPSQDEITFSAGAENPAWLQHLRVLSQKLQDAELVEEAAIRTPVSKVVDSSQSLDSAVRQQGNSCLFRTPPEFKGFTDISEINSP